jgi:hypothetical protein
MTPPRRGALPPGMRPMGPPLVGGAGQPHTPDRLGVGMSGPNVRELVPNSQDECVLDVRRPASMSDGCDGLATVHIEAHDCAAPTVAGVDNPTGRIICTCRYNDGVSGGEFSFDLTRATLLSLGGTDTIAIYARWVSDANDDTPGAAAPTVFRTKRIEANVNWLGSVSPKASRITLDPIAVAAGVPSAWFRIPRQAESLLALGTLSSRMPGVTAEFTRNSAGGTVIYDTLNPNANGTPIVHGVEFVRFTSPADITIIPMFELWP